jgi:hypothetical protein
MENEEKLIQMLKSYDYFKASIKFLEENIIDIIESGMGINYEKEKLSKTNKFSSVIEVSVIQMDKLYIPEKLKSMKNTIKSIDAAMAVLNDIERLIVEHRCIKKEYYYQFCYKICVSERTAKRLRKQALDKMSIIVFGKY